jgi:hypothetical protein
MRDTSARSSISRVIAGVVVGVVAAVGEAASAASSFFDGHGGGKGGKGERVERRGESLLQTAGREGVCRDLSGTTEHHSPTPVPREVATLGLCGGGTRSRGAPAVQATSNAPPSIDEENTRRALVFPLPWLPFPFTLARSPKNRGPPGVAASWISVTSRRDRKVASASVPRGGMVFRGERKEE